jgi:hypothetical protein
MPSSSSPVKVVHGSGSMRPLFFFHGDYRGGPIWAMQLARELGPDQPVYLFEPGQLNGRVAPTLESLVAEQLEALLSIQPEGPYVLGGWCGGALTAFEIAQQLHARGQQVALLALMEPAVLTAPIRLFHAALRRLGRGLRLNPERQLDWFIRILRVYEPAGALYRRLLLNGGSGDEPLNAVTGESRRRTTWLRQRGRPPATHPPAIPGDVRTQATGRPRGDVNRILVWLIAEYRVRSYPGRVTFFRCREEHPEGPAARRLAYEIANCAAAAESRVLEGTHISCRTEHVVDMARTLQECICREDSRYTGGSVC